MANTTNLNLSKLAGTEKLKSFPSPYNDNMDAIDGAFGADFGVSGKPSVNAELNSLGDGLAILANGNTHAAITSGQFVYVRGHGTLADGLYQATSNIAQDGTLSGSNLTADSSGGLNTVYSSLNSKIAIAITPATDIVIDSNESYRVGKNGVIAVTFHPTSNTVGSNVAFTVDIPSKMSQTGAVFPIGVGATQWDINGVDYGYVSDYTIIARALVTGKYYHVLVPFILY